MNVVDMIAANSKSLVDGNADKYLRWAMENGMKPGQEERFARKCFDKFRDELLLDEKLLTTFSEA